jgi:hypothetical protein
MSCGFWSNAAIPTKDQPTTLSPLQVDEPGGPTVCIAIHDNHAGVALNRHRSAQLAERAPLWCVAEGGKCLLQCG